MATSSDQLRLDRSDLRGDGGGALPEIGLDPLRVRRVQQRRCYDFLPALRRRFEFAVPPHKIGKGRNATERAAKLVLDVAQHRSERTGVERLRWLVREIDRSSAARIVVDDAGG